MSDVSVLRKLGILAGRDVACEASRAVLAKALKDPAHAPTSVLIAYLNPVVLAAAIPLDADDDFEDRAIGVLATEIDRRIPAQPEVMR
jgi:hypothetical protein